MSPDGRHLTEDVDDFLARAGDFLRSRPVLHTVPLTVTEALRTRGTEAYGDDAPVFGLLERAGEVRATFFRTPPCRLILTPLTSEEADSLAAHLADLGHSLPGVNADHDTATSFAEAWQRHTGAIRRWTSGSVCTAWARSRHRSRSLRAAGESRVRKTVSDSCSGTASSSPTSGELPLRTTAHGRTRVSPTNASRYGKPRTAPPSPWRAGPPWLRARSGWPPSRSALAAGAAEVLLFADLANPTSNGLYQRIGYRPVADFAVYDF